MHFELLVFSYFLGYCLDVKIFALYPFIIIFSFMFLIWFIKKLKKKILFWSSLLFKLQFMHKMIASSGHAFQVIYFMWKCGCIYFNCNVCANCLKWIRFWEIWDFFKLLFKKKNYLKQRHGHKHIINEISIQLYIIWSFCLICDCLEVWMSHEI